jgi:hypothetical protein
MIRALLAAAALAATSLAGIVPAEAKAHHYPMAPPLSVTCSTIADPYQQFLCLHPGYKLVLTDLRGLSITFSSPTGCEPAGLPGPIVVNPSTGRDSCGIKRI